MLRTAALLLCGATAALRLPHRTYPILDPLKQPFGGAQLAANVTHTRLLFATKDIGTYNMAPMIDYHDGQLLAWWKNSPTDEDQAGQKILYSQSLDGKTWTTPGSGAWDRPLFPNMSTTGYHAALFAEPMLHINGRHYAAASPSQFSLYPNQVGANPKPQTLIQTPILNPKH